MGSVVRGTRKRILYLKTEEEAGRKSTRTAVYRID
jgi:hypothetical protein